MTNKERPILFNAQMVNAILDGRKTQTRRVIKHQPPGDNYELNRMMDSSWSGDKKNIGKLHWLKLYSENVDDGTSVFFNSPFGFHGDMLWVKETWTTRPGLDDVKPSEISKNQSIGYIADDKGPWLGKTRPSIFMMRWMSRIQLEVRSIRVERLNDISEEDARAEGANPINFGYGDCYALGFNQLWESINGQGSWDLNPWVWVVEFKAISNE